MTVQTFGKASPEALYREANRLAALEQLDMLDTPRDPGFDRLVQLIKEIFRVDIAIISLIDAHRQWYKSCSGMPVNEVAREETFCQHVVLSEQAIVVPDATKDPLFAQNPSVVGDDHIRFYAGVPLKTAEGHVIGTVCAIDRRPGSFSRRDLAILEGIAAIAMDRIELLKSASTDGLTGLLNRRAFKDEASQAISSAIRHRQDLACIIFDVDHFKRVNDTYGHAAGDEVLRAVAEACRAVLRAEDRLGRIGGEEFAIILPQTGREAAGVVAEKVRTAIAAQTVAWNGGSIGVTASLGLTSLSIVAKDIDTLLAQADVALYRAKSSGRNRCIDWGAGTDEAMASGRRRVLKAGNIIFNDRRSTVDCTVKTFGTGGAGLRVMNSVGIPPEFLLAIKGEGFETECRVVMQDGQNIEVAFR